MYAVRRWDEEVVKWLAVGMCLSLAFGLFVLNNTDVSTMTKLYLEYKHGTLDWGTLIAALPEIIDFVAIVGGIAALGGGPIAVIAYAAVLGFPLVVE